MTTYDEPRDPRIEIIPSEARGDLLLRIEVIPMDGIASNPLIREEATCSDLFGVVHELERVTGPRLRRRIHEAAAANLLRLNPRTGRMTDE